MNAGGIKPPKFLNNYTTFSYSILFVVDDIM